tara:strand:- start:893 stop:1321 length:429 start_codon:yes stop_codon:yes gene_type:complete
MKSQYNTLDEIWEQANLDAKSKIIILAKGQTVISAGVKIQKFDDGIQIFNMNKGGDYFKILDDYELNLFLEFGWALGCIKLSITNCRYKLGLIERKIQNEVNTRKNDKHIQNLKTRRENILKKYTILQSKLNQVKSKNKANE